MITEVELQAVTRFNVEQLVKLSDITYVKQNLERLLQENEHFSLYLFPFTDRCQINTWNRTIKPKSFCSGLREFLSISLDALLAAWAGNFMAYTGLLPALSSRAHGLKRGTD